MATFLKIVAQLGVKAAKWAWANRKQIMDLIAKGFGITYIVDYINSRA